MESDHSSSDLTVGLERQLERFEQQVKILKEVLSANGSSERVELLRDHADKEVCALVLCLLDKAKLQQLAAELQAYNDLKTRVEDSTLKKNLQRNIQEHGSPGAFWEAEQESLLFGIEMKGERVQEQSRKLEQMDELVERNMSLEAQLVHVLQQNKDLKVQIDNFYTLIQ